MSGIDLEQLLARAVALEAKADAALVEADPVAELAEVMDALEGSSVPGVDPEADADAADDLDEFEVLGDDFGIDDDFGDLEPEGKAAGWGPCPECGSTDADEYADGTARCEDCGTPLVGTEHKDFDVFDDGVDVDVKAADEYVRDQVGKFARGKRRGSDDGKAEGDKPRGEDAEDRYQFHDAGDVRDLARMWGDIPMKDRAALKKRMQAFLRARTDGWEHEKLSRLVDGLGDGDGKLEEGEGAGAAMRHGRAREWLDNHPSKKADDAPLETKGADDRVPISELELLRARRAALD